MAEESLFEYGIVEVVAANNREDMVKFTPYPSSTRVKEAMKQSADCLFRPVSLYWEPSGSKAVPRLPGWLLDTFRGSDQVHDRIVYGELRVIGLLNTSEQFFTLTQTPGLGCVIWPAKKIMSGFMVFRNRQFSPEEILRRFCKNLKFEPTLAALCLVLQACESAAEPISAQIEATHRWCDQLEEDDLMSAAYNTHLEAQILTRLRELHRANASLFRARIWLQRAPNLTAVLKDVEDHFTNRDNNGNKYTQGFLGRAACRTPDQQTENDMHKRAAAEILARAKDQLRAIKHTLDSLEEVNERLTVIGIMTREVAAQRDKERKNQIANHTLLESAALKNIAEAAFRDSSAMKTISIMTMIFLPGTFLCSFFSMTMFNFSPGQNGQIVSEYWWIYPTCMIPLTAAVVLIWWWSTRERRQREKKEHVKMC